MAANHYVKNKDFLQAIIEHKEKVKNTPEGEPKPQVSNYIATCLLLIAKNLAHKPSFNQYSFKEEMIGDAVENSIRYFHNFNPEKYSNPFAYFTQISKFAFIRRIAKEKKQLYVKYKATEQWGILDEHEQLEGEDGTTKQFELYDNISEFIGNYEEAQRNKKKKETKKTKLELFMEEDDVPALEEALGFIDDALHLNEPEEIIVDEDGDMK